MYWPCMIANIPLVAGNKLNCFIIARGMLVIILNCASSNKNILICYGLLKVYLEIMLSNSVCSVYVHMPGILMCMTSQDINESCTMHSEVT